jgi:hypothetical protein
MSNHKAWMPQAIFDDLGMHYRVVDVTWAAWSADVELVWLEEIPKSFNGQDHGWLLLTLRPKK